MQSEFERTSRGSQTRSEPSCVPRNTPLDSAALTFGAPVAELADAQA